MSTKGSSSPSISSTEKEKLFSFPSADTLLPPEYKSKYFVGKIDSYRIADLNKELREFNNIISDTAKNYRDALARLDPKMKFVLLAGELIELSLFDFDDENKNIEKSKITNVGYKLLLPYIIRYGAERDGLNYELKFKNLLLFYFKFYVQNKANDSLKQFKDSQVLQSFMERSLDFRAGYYGEKNESGASARRNNFQRQKQDIEYFKSVINELQNLENGGESYSLREYFIRRILNDKKINKPNDIFSNLVEFFQKFPATKYLKDAEWKNFLKVEYSTFFADGLIISIVKEILSRLGDNQAKYKKLLNSVFFSKLPSLIGAWYLIDKRFILLSSESVHPKNYANRNKKDSDDNSSSRSKLEIARLKGLFAFIKRSPILSIEVADFINERIWISRFLTGGIEEKGKSKLSIKEGLYTHISNSLKNEFNSMEANGGLVPVIEDFFRQFSLQNKSQAEKIKEFKSFLVSWRYRAWLHDFICYACDGLKLVPSDDLFRRFSFDRKIVFFKLYLSEQEAGFRNFIQYCGSELKFGISGDSRSYCRVFTTDMSFNDDEKLNPKDEYQFLLIFDGRNCFEVYRKSLDEKEKEDAKDIELFVCDADFLSEFEFLDKMVLLAETENEE